MEPEQTDSQLPLTPPEHQVDFGGQEPEGCAEEGVDEEKEFSDDECVEPVDMHDESLHANVLLLEEEKPDKTTEEPRETLLEKPRRGQKRAPAPAPEPEDAPEPEGKSKKAKVSGAVPEGKACQPDDSVPRPEDVSPEPSLSPIVCGALDSDEEKTTSKKSAKGTHKV